MKEKDATPKQAEKLIHLFGDKTSKKLRTIPDSGLSLNSPLLDFIGTVTVSSIIGSFVASEKFVFNTSQKTRVEINFLGNNFSEWFLGKIEKPMAKNKLCYAELKKYSVDAPIITEIGGKDKAETTLAEMFSLMEKQGNDETSVLLANGCANIFYIRDKNGVLRVVYCVWSAGGWDVSANSVGSPGWWHGAGRWVFFRNFVA